MMGQGRGERSLRRPLPPKTSKTWKLKTKYKLPNPVAIRIMQESSDFKGQIYKGL